MVGEFTHSRCRAVGPLFAGHQLPAPCRPLAVLYTPTPTASPPAGFLAACTLEFVSGGQAPLVRLGLVQARGAALRPHCGRSAVCGCMLLLPTLVPASPNAHPGCSLTACGSLPPPLLAQPGTQLADAPWCAQSLAVLACFVGLSAQLQPPPAPLLNLPPPQVRPRPRRPLCRKRAGPVHRAGQGGRGDVLSLQAFQGPLEQRVRAGDGSGQTPHPPAQHKTQNQPPLRRYLSSSAPSAGPPLT